MAIEMILEVSQLNQYVKRTIESDPVLRSVRLRGEISNFRPNSSGHWYFTLKDDQCRVSCVMFRSSAMRTSFRPRDGMAVIVSGRVSLYEATGAYQFYADSMRPDGVGGLYMQFEQLKAKLQAQGLFDQERKKPIPYRPRKIAVVTSRTGAVLHDICRVAGQRDPGVPIVLLPVQVQGEGAAAEIASAIRRACLIPQVDVIITGRGGGSMEDLWAFNEEIVARAIADSPVPVISAVGHETDFTIADFVADRRASTPSNAAEIATPDAAEIVEGLREMQEHLHRAMMEIINDRKYRILLARRTLEASRPENRLQGMRQRIVLARQRLYQAAESAAGQLQPRVSMAQVRLDSAMDRLVQTHQERLQRAQARLQAINPERVLQRGYALVMQGDRVIPSRAAAEKERRMTLRFADGTVNVIKEEHHGGEEKADL